MQEDVKKMKKVYDGKTKCMNTLKRSTFTDSGKTGAPYVALRARLQF